MRIRLRMGMHPLLPTRRAISQDRGGAHTGTNPVEVLHACPARPGGVQMGAWGQYKLGSLVRDDPSPRTDRTDTGTNARLRLALSAVSLPKETPITG
jgi:hypothetical protein